MAEQDRLEWDERYSGSSPVTTLESAPFLRKLLEFLPDSGRLLDVAGGRGEGAIWFAKRGYDVTLVDISRVASDLAHRAAQLHGVGLRVLTLDLEEGFPSGPWDVIHCHHYFNRALFVRYPRELVPGGVLALSHPTVVNLERNPRPGKRYLYDLGEMRALVEASGLKILYYEEGWSPRGKHEARLIARSEPSG